MIRNATVARSHRGRIGDVTSALIGGGIGAGVSLATTGLSLWMNSIQQSHAADTGTTVIVNGLADQLLNLLNAYMAEPSPTCADQRAALDMYDQAWQWLQSPQACGNPSFGSAGNRCISDRAPNGQYPWQQYYRDPIANDPRLLGQCDTSAQVLLPSLQTGTYQPVTQIVNPPAVVTQPTTLPADVSASATVSAGLSNYVLIGGFALITILLFSGGSRS